jgi:hypothetical protein
MILPKSRNMSLMILEALAAKYEADMQRLQVNINNYFSNSVGVAEHPDIVEEVDKLIEQVATAEEKLKIVNEIYEVEKGNLDV